MNLAQTKISEFLILHLCRCHHYAGSDRLPMQVFRHNKHLSIQNLPKQANIHLRAGAVLRFPFNQFTKYLAACCIVRHSVLVFRFYCVAPISMRLYTAGCTSEFFYFYSGYCIGPKKWLRTVTGAMKN